MSGTTRRIVAGNPQNPLLRRLRLRQREERNLILQGMPHQAALLDHFTRAHRLPDPEYMCVKEGLLIVHWLGGDFPPGLTLLQVNFGAGGIHSWRSSIVAGETSDIDSWREGDAEVPPEVINPLQAPGPA